jgi:hypothetical protein
MQRYIWTTTDLKDDYILYTCEDLGDSYTDKDYLGPVIGTATICPNGQVVLEANPNSESELEYYQRQRVLASEFKKTFGNRQLHSTEKSNKKL